MARPIRVTNPLLDVLEVLLDAFNNGEQELHGWAIMKTTARTGPTVYGVLDRLEDVGWITSRWEERHPEQNKPRRCFYQLTPTGEVNANQLLTKRRPKSVHRSQRPQPGLAFSDRLRALAREASQ